MEADRDLRSPMCGTCGKTMTPENSTYAPEWFLCDECAVENHIKPVTKRCLTFDETVLRMRELLAPLVPRSGAVDANGIIFFMMSHILLLMKCPEGVVDDRITHFLRLCEIEIARLNNLKVEMN